MYIKFHYLLLFVAGVLSCLAGQGQVEFTLLRSQVTPADFHPSSPVIDSNVNVVVLCDSASVDLLAFSYGWRVRQTRYCRMLIRNKNGFDAAKIEVSFDPEANGVNKLISLQANTCNLAGDKIVTTNVDTSEMFLDETSGGRMKERFTFPDIREGSVIEYTYTIFSKSVFDLRPWDFQGAYPCLNSSYLMSFPGAFNYAVTKKGFLPITRSDESRDTVYQPGSFSMRTKKYIIHWSMKDVPPFKPEPYLPAPFEYLAGLRFQLSEYTNLERRARIKVDNTWDEVNKELYKAKMFGGIMTASSHWLRKEMRTIVDDSVNALDKARTIYGYVRDHFTNTGRAVIADEDQSLKDIFKAHKGSVAEINLLLTAMLREDGLTADAVILSTRDNGRVNPHYPVIDNFNYVVVRLQIAGSIYFLDASEPRMGFGRLPAECYSGYARVVSEHADSVVLNADSITESKVVTILLSNNDRGDSLSGTYTAKRGYYTSLHIRDEIAEGGESKYFESEQKGYPFPVEISEKHVDSLKQYDLPVEVHYSLAFPVGDDDRIYFNPMLSEAMKENLFSAAERNYPVEMPYKVDDLFVMRMEIPHGYIVEEMPKSARVRLGDGDGSFEFLIQADDQAVQMRCRLVLSRTNFQPEAYEALRNFFAAVMKKQGEAIVFKKK